MTGPHFIQHHVVHRAVRTWTADGHQVEAQTVCGVERRRTASGRRGVYVATVAEYVTCKRCRDAGEQAAQSMERGNLARYQMGQHVARGTCPQCGRPLRRNASLTGWWQCSQYGAVTHRADPTQPSCDFQGFTE